MRGRCDIHSLILRKTHDASKTAIAHISRVSEACGCDGQVDYGGRMPTIMMRISAGEEAKYVQRLCKYLKVVHAKGRSLNVISEVFED